MVLRFQTPPLFLPRCLAERLERWAEDALPAEACGLLVGERAPDGVHVREVVRLSNAAPARVEDLFELDPEEQLAVEQAAEAAGLEVVGVWHSHPDSAARPSPTDTERAWEGWSYPIVGFAAHGARRELRSWRIGPAGPVEEPIEHRAHRPRTLALDPRFLRPDAPVPER